MAAKPKNYIDPFIEEIAAAVWARSPIKPEFLRTDAPKPPPALEPTPSAPPPIGKSMKIGEWCVKERISRSNYYKRRKEGIGPRETRFGASVRITPEADAEWRAAQAETAA
jgi:hypothetical protein